MSKSIAILGATGTIGINTLDVVRQHPQKFTVFALTANTNYEKLLILSKEFLPKYVVLVDEKSAEKFQQRAKLDALDVHVLSGAKSLSWVVKQQEVDMVMAAIVGAAGLLPNLAAVKAGKKMLLANKESLVMSGQLFMDCVKENNVDLLPIDSEHNAIFQCLPNNQYIKESILDVLLTASGGPFLTTDINSFDKITPEQAVAHPNWVMGKKISVDSATMMNKGLEVIEACWLFDITEDKINVVIHPESIVHSMVRYKDGSVLAQLGNPDMRTPIAYSMAWPKRIESGVEPLDIFKVGQLNFTKPDLSRFPCLKIAQNVANKKGTCSAIMNAANEVAVDAFLNKQIRYTDIAKIIEATLEKTPNLTATKIENILKSDKEARMNSLEVIASL